MESKRIRDIEGYESFKVECTFFKCDEEYPGWVGEERYGIITGLTRDELETKYPQFIAVMSPYVLLDLEFGSIRAKDKRNQDKFDKRAKINNSIYELDEEAAAMHPELSVPDFLTEMLEQAAEAERRREQIMLCREILSHFNAKQKGRLVKRFLLKKTVQAIADEEGCSVSSIHESLKRAENKFKEIYGKTRKSGVTHSIHYEGVSSILDRIAASEKKNESNEEN